jgi:hypothetical protein
MLHHSGALFWFKDASLWKSLHETQLLSSLEHHARPNRGRKTGGAWTKLLYVHFIGEQNVPNLYYPYTTLKLEYAPRDVGRNGNTIVP